MFPHSNRESRNRKSDDRTGEARKQDHAARLSPHLGWLVTVVLLSSAAAQTQSTPQSTPLSTPLSTTPGAPDSALTCPPEESYVDVNVAGISRGGAWVRTGAPDGRTWLERSAIRPGEEAYFDAVLTCDEIHLARLNRDLRLVFNPETLTLSFEPELSLLGTSSFTVQGVHRAPLPGVPLLNLAYDLSAGTDLRQADDRTQNGRGFSGQYNVRLEYLQGPFSTFVGVRQTLSSALVSDPALYARARYAFGQASSVQASSVQAVFNLPTTLNFWHGPFSGVQADFSGNQTRYWPALSVTLPLAADVTLTVDGQELQRQRHMPGTLTLTHIPLARQEGQIVLEIDDETGHRSVSQPYAFPTDLLAPGGYAARLEGGWLNAQPYAAGSARYGLTPGLTLEGEAGVTGNAAQGSVSAVIAPPGQLMKLGVGGRTFGAEQTLFLKGQYRYASPSFTAEISAEVPVFSSALIPPEPRGEAALRYAGPNFSAALSGGYSTDMSGWYGRLEGSVPISRAHLNVLPFVTVTSRSTRVGVGVNWNPDRNIQVQAGVQSTFGQTAGTALDLTHFTLAVSDQLTPQSRVTASTDLNDATLGYRYRGALEANIAAGTSGTLSAQLQGRASLIGGRVSFTLDSGTQRFILLKTGVPDLAITAEGVPQGRTDAQGELLLTVQGAENSQVQVDTDTLPIEVSLQSETLSVNVPDEGAVVVDWTSNFRRSHFVVFQDAQSQNAGGGNVTWPEQDPIDLDDAGEGLLPRLQGTVTGTLTFSDGRTCPVTIEPGANLVKCAP